MIETMNLLKLYEMSLQKVACTVVWLDGDLMIAYSNDSQLGFVGQHIGKLIVAQGGAHWAEVCVKASEFKDRSMVIKGQLKVIEQTGVVNEVIVVIKRLALRLA